MERDRCQPHAPSRAYPNEHANAEAGPSNLAAPPPANPSGGTSEASADAENSNTETEENAAPVSHFYCSRVPRGPEWVFGDSLGALEAAENYARRVSGTRYSWEGCASGLRNGRGSQNSQHRGGLWQVSTYTYS